MGGGKQGFLSLVRKKKCCWALLRVEGSGEVLHQMNTKVFSVLDNLHPRSVDVRWRVVSLWFPEVKNNLFSFVSIQRQVVGFAQVC